MKKSFFAVSIAAGLAGVAQADTTNIYGSIGVATGVQSTNISGLVSTNQQFDINIYRARFGVKGTENLASGLKAFWNFEFDIDRKNDFQTKDGNQVNNGLKGITKTRKANLGFEGDFGKVTLGLQPSVFASFVGNQSGDFNVAELAAGTADSLSSYNNAITYKSANFSGFKFGLGAVAAAGGNLFDAYDIGVSYDNNGIKAGAAYQARHDQTAANTGRKTEVIAVEAGYEVKDAFKVGAGYQRTLGSAVNHFHIGGAYNINESNIINAAVGYNDSTQDTLSVALGYENKLSKRTRAFVEGTFNSQRISSKNSSNNYRIGVGVRHDF